MSMAQVSTSRQRRFAAGESSDGRHPADAGQAVATPHHRPFNGTLRAMQMEPLICSSNNGHHFEQVIGEALVTGDSGPFYCLLP